MRKFIDFLVTIGLVSGLVAGLAACDTGRYYEPFQPRSVLQIIRTTFETVEGSEVQYSAMWFAGSGTTRVVTDQVRWSTSDPSLAEFSTGKAGNLVTKAYGTVEIIAEYGSKKDKAELIILPAVEAVEISPLSTKAALNATQSFVATAIYRDKSKKDVTAEATWSTSSFLKAEAVGPGQVEGKLLGSVKVTATQGGVTGEATLLVEPAGESTLVLSPAGATIEMVGCGVEMIVPTAAFSLTRLTAPGGSRDVTGDAEWTSSDDELATVSKDGVVTPVAMDADGETVTISAKFEDLTGEVIKQAEVELVVKSLGEVAENLGELGEISAARKKVLLGTDTWLALDATEPASEGGGELDATSFVYWISDDVRVAKFSAPGAVWSRGPGSTEIMATLTCDAGEDDLGNKKDPLEFESANKIVVQVTAQADSIAVTPAPSAPLEVGDSHMFTATASYDDTTQDITTEATWECVDAEGARSDVAAMDNSTGASGMATATAVGSCDVVARFNGVVSEPVTLDVE